MATLTAQQAVDLGHGKRVEASDAAGADVAPGTVLAAIDPEDRLVAIVERRGSTLKVVTGFPADGAGS